MTLYSNQNDKQGGCQCGQPHPENKPFVIVSGNELWLVKLDEMGTILPISTPTRIPAEWKTLLNK